MTTTLNGRPDTILKHDKYKLTANPLPDATLNKFTSQPNPPQVETQLVYNEWHFKCYTNSREDSAGRGKGIIEAKMDAPTYYSVLQAITLVSNSVLERLVNPALPENHGFNVIVIENKTPAYEGGKATGQTYVQSTTYVGADEEGIYLSVRAKNRPEINFYFKSSDYHTVKAKINGNPNATSLLNSALYAASYARSMMQVCTNLATEHSLTYAEIKEAKAQAKVANQARFQGKQGGYNNNGQNYNRSGQNQAPSAPAAAAVEFDDDIMF